MPSSILLSHLRLALSLPASSGQASICWKHFLTGNQPSGLIEPVSSRGLSGLSQIPSLLVLSSHQEGLWAKPSHPQVRTQHLAREGFLDCSILQTRASSRSWRKESPPQIPPNTYSFRAHLGRLLTQKGPLYKTGWLGPRTDSPLGIPRLQASLRWVAFEPGRRSTTDFSPRKESLPSVRQGAQNGRSASLAVRRLGSSEREAWMRPASELAPCRLYPAGPEVGRGLGPLNIAPSSDRDSARRAQRWALRGRPRPAGWPRQSARP